MVILLLLFLPLFSKEKNALNFNMQVPWTWSTQRNEWKSLSLQFLQEDLVWEKDLKVILCNYKFPALKIYDTFKTLK